MPIFKRKPEVSSPLPQLNLNRFSGLRNKPEEIQTLCVDYFRSVIAWAESVKNKQMGIKHNKADLAWAAILTSQEAIFGALSNHGNEDLLNSVLSVVDDIMLEEVEPKFGKWFEAKQATYKDIPYREYMKETYPNQTNQSVGKHGAYTPEKLIHILKSAIHGFKANGENEKDAEKHQTPKLK